MDSSTGSAQLRTYVHIDSLQPQVARYLGLTSKGYMPSAGESSLWVEATQPGLALDRIREAIGKSSKAKIGPQVVERSITSVAIVHSDLAEVASAGAAVLNLLDQQPEHSKKCKVLWQETVEGSEPGKARFILETEPAGYIIHAANEAERAAPVALAEVRAFGAFGRLTLAGATDDVARAAQAALKAVTHA